MIDQITDSIQHDCDSDYWKEKLNQKPLPVAEYRTEQLAKATRDIAYHEKNWNEEVERTNKRNEWKRQLLDNLAGKS